MSGTPLTDAINALTTYSNTVTGASDTTLSEAVATLASGYGGGGDSVAMVMKTIGFECFRYVHLPETLIFPNVTRLDSRCFGGATGLKTLVLPAVSSLDSYPLADNVVIQTIDFGENTPTFGSYSLSGNTSLTTLILRKTSDVIALGNLNAFNNTPFKNGGSGGTVYVPQALINSYQSANNWSTVLGYANNGIQAIEGSYYETHYADGTPIE